MTASLTITFDWPNAALSPNARVHHMALHLARKAAKNDAWAVTKAAMRPLGITPATWRGPVDVSITFQPSSNRVFDLDNAMARLKGHLDGVAMALGIDDSAFTFRLARGERAVPARVVVTLTPCEVLIQHRGTVS